MLLAVNLPKPSCIHDFPGRKCHMERSQKPKVKTYPAVAPFCVCDMIFSGEERHCSRLMSNYWKISCLFFSFHCYPLNTYKLLLIILFWLFQAIKMPCFCNSILPFSKLEISLPPHFLGCLEENHCRFESCYNRLHQELPNLRITKILSKVFEPKILHMFFI